MRWAIVSTALPGSVIATMRLPLRTKISIPNSSSNSLICLLMPGCEVYSALAAAEIFNPCCTISFRNLSCCRFMALIQYSNWL